MRAVADIWLQIQTDTLPRTEEGGRAQGTMNATGKAEGMTTTAAARDAQVNGRMMTTVELLGTTTGDILGGVTKTDGGETTTRGEGTAKAEDRETATETAGILEKENLVIGTIEIEGETDTGTMEETVGLVAVAEIAMGTRRGAGETVEGQAWRSSELETLLVRPLRRAQYPSQSANEPRLPGILRLPDLRPLLQCRAS